MALNGTRLAHFTQAGARQRLIKQKAWTANGAEIVSDPHNATHIIVGAWNEPLDFENIPILKESWPSDCIETGKQLEVVGYQYLKRADAPSSSPEPEINRSRKAARQSAFSFNNKTSESCPNQEILDFFHELANQRSASGKEFSKRAYDRAITAVEDIPVPIKSVEQAVKLIPSVFKGRIKQSLESLLSGKIPAAALEAMREKSQTLAKFQAAIYGVGAKRALEFYNMGCRTLSDVRDSTTDPRMIASIDHSQELLQRISRSEVERHYELVTQVVKELDPQAETMCMGSYRRQKKDCGDIDIIITKQGSSRQTVLEITKAAIAKLFERKIAVFTFGGDGSHRWLGATVIPEVGSWRRIDLLSVKYEELGAAMCYYTGTDMFNRCMRFRAQKIGMQLNETGLFQKGTDLLLESASEARIFEKLGIEWRDPPDRVPEKFQLIE